MVIGNEKAIEILTGIKNFCSSNSCGECPLSLTTCDELFSRESAPVDWEIDLKAHTEKEVTGMSGVNRMRGIVSLLGVEFGEEFKVIGGWEEYNPYHFTRYGVIDNAGENANHILPKLIRGDYTIEKVPFTPKDGEEYFTYYFSGYDSSFNGRILANSWEGSPIDKMNKLLGIVFRTEKEAKDYLPTFKRRLEGEEV